MAKNKSLELFKKLKKMKSVDREAMAQRPDSRQILSLLSPTQYAELFPRLPRGRPDVGGFDLAITRKTQKQQADWQSGVNEKLAKSGGSSGGGRGGAMGGGGLPNVDNMTPAERNFLGLVLKYESGNRNIPNYINDRTHTAQGYFQLTNTNWRNLAPKLGITAPDAMHATKEEQTRVALALLRQSGQGNWVNFNPSLRQAVARGETAQFEVSTGDGSTGRGGGGRGSGPDFTQDIMFDKSMGKCGIGTRNLAGKMFKSSFFENKLSIGGDEHAGSLSAGNNYFQKSGFYRDGRGIGSDHLTPEYLDSLPIGTVISSQGGHRGGHVQIKIGPGQWASDFGQNGYKFYNGGYDNFVVHEPNEAGLARLSENGIVQPGQDDGSSGSAKVEPKQTAPDVPRTVIDNKSEISPEDTAGEKTTEPVKEKTKQSDISAFVSFKPKEDKPKPQQHEHHKHDSEDSVKPKAAPNRHVPGYAGRGRRKVSGELTFQELVSPVRGDDTFVTDQAGNSFTINRKKEEIVRGNSDTIRIEHKKKETPEVLAAQSKEQIVRNSPDTATIEQNKNVAPSGVTNRAEKFLSLVAHGEGGYNSMNQGTRKGKIVGSTHDSSSIVGKNLTDMTVGEIMDMQKGSLGSGRQLFAVGKYQLIPKTMQAAVKTAGISRETKFDEATQEKLGMALIQNRPKLHAYLTGKSDNIHAAMVDASKEWASLPHPDTGSSFYKSGNKSSHSVESVKQSLIAARGDMTAPDTSPTQVAQAPAATPAAAAPVGAPPAPEQGISSSNMSLLSPSSAKAKESMSTTPGSMNLSAQPTPHVDVKSAAESAGISQTPRAAISSVSRIDPGAVQPGKTSQFDLLREQMSQGFGAARAEPPAPKKQAAAEAPDFQHQSLISTQIASARDPYGGVASLQRAGARSAFGAEGFNLDYGNKT